MGPCFKIKVHTDPCPCGWQQYHCPHACLCACALQVLPHPINTQVPLAIPGAPAEAASSLEDQLLLQGLLTAHVSARKLPKPVMLSIKAVL